MEPEVELEILDVLETNATEPLQRLCRLLEFSELEINSGLSQLKVTLASLATISKLHYLVKCTFLKFAAEMGLQIKHTIPDYIRDMRYDVLIRAFVKS